MSVRIVLSLRVRSVTQRHIKGRIPRLSLGICGGRPHTTRSKGACSSSRSNKRQIDYSWLGCSYLAIERHSQPKLGRTYALGGP